MSNEKAMTALAKFRALPKDEQAHRQLKKAAENLKAKVNALRDIRAKNDAEVSEINRKIIKHGDAIKKLRAKLATLPLRLENAEIARNSALDKARVAKRKLDAALNPEPKKETAKQRIEREAAAAGMDIASYKIKIMAEKAASKKAEMHEQKVKANKGVANRTNPPARTAPTTSEILDIKAVAEKQFAKMMAAAEKLTPEAQIEFYKIMGAV